MLYTCHGEICIPPNQENQKMAQIITETTDGDALINRQVPTHRQFLSIEAVLAECEGLLVSARDLIEGLRCVCHHAGNGHHVFVNKEKRQVACAACWRML